MINLLRHLKPDRMIQGDSVIFRADDVVNIDLTYLEDECVIVMLKSLPNSPAVSVTGFNALELVWLLKAGALEGKRIKFPKHSWVLHNMIAHPVMQILAFLRCYKAAMWVHDSTVPKPSSRA